MKLILIQTLAFWFMTGVTWVLQQLNYPLIEKVNPDNIESYLTTHNKRFGPLMMPGVLVSVITTLMLFFMRPAQVSILVPVCQILLLLVIVGSAATYAAPAHKKLGRGFDATTHRLLVITNWIRLAAWVVLSIGGICLLQS